jgi:hypothetical protein
MMGGGLAYVAESNANGLILSLPALRDHSEA